MDENFPPIMKCIKPKIQESQRTLSRIKPQTKTCHITVKLLKILKKEKILKKARDKSIFCVEETQRIRADCFFRNSSQKTMEEYFSNDNTKNQVKTKA